MNIVPYDEAYKASLEYFNNDNLAAKVFVDKYALRDNDGNLLEKTPEEMHWRLAGEFARIESKKFKKPLSKEEIFSYLDRFKYIVPQGGILYGLGNNKQYVTLSNCYVIDPPADSYGGICWSDEQLVQISKRRGGCGTHLSFLRPNKTPTKNSSRTSTGPISFAKRFSHSIREVGQDGRRGALMLMMHDKHPNASEFVQSKRNIEEITGANISLAIYDKFIVSALKDGEYEQQWPIDSLNPTIKQTIKAKKLWDTIVKTAWESAEPGVLFWDTIIRESISDCYAKLGFNTVCVNPCQPGWGKVLTPNGIRTINDIKIGDNIWSKDGWTNIINKYSSGIKDVYKYETTAGRFFGTQEHQVLCNNKKIFVKDATGIDIIRGNRQTNIVFDCQAIMDGLVLGDGSYHKASNNLVYLIIGENDQDYFSSEIKHLITKHRPSLCSNGISYEINTTISYKEIPYTYLRKIPQRYIESDYNTKCSFLRGLYSANGSICDKRVTLKSASKQIIEDIQLMLSSIGIKSYYTTNLEKDVEFINGIYTCKQSYDLNISIDIDIFANNIGFIQQYKNKKLQKIIESYNNKKRKDKKLTHNIIEITKISTEETFDITVDNLSHTYWTEGCNVSNCGELPLPALDSCRLLLLNLFSFVVNPFTSKAYFDYDLFYSTAQIAQRLMDDIIDLELECIDRIITKIKDDPEPLTYKERELNMWERIRSMCANGRRTGTGTTALADTFAALNIKYGSKKSLGITDRIFKTLKFGCYESSMNMAKEIGTFPIWSYELEKDNPFLNRIKDETIEIDGKEISGADLYNNIKQYGRRNIACMTLSPAGTISVETQTTSGGEPLLYLSMKRRKKGNLTDENFRCDFTDANGDNWMEFEFDHPKFTLWKEITKKTDIEESPWYGCCAEDLNYLSRIELQGTIQKHIDHSISSTINLPENTKVETVANIYEEAWKHGCKGVTIYRKGCRSGVILDNSIPKRPKELPCDVYHTSVGGTGYFVCIGILDGPYEVFAGKNGNIGNNVKRGIIVRKKKGFYKAIFEEDDTELSPITSFSTDTEEAITRLVSTLLRAKTDINLIVTQLERVGGNCAATHSFAKAIARILKKYIKDGAIIDGEFCPECQAQLIRKEGCWSCSKCSYSKCS